MRELLHPDVAFTVCRGWPGGGRTFRGPDEVLDDFFPAAAESWEWVKPHVDEVIEGNSGIVVRGHYAGVARPSSVPFELQYVHIWRVADGRLIALDQVADTAILADAVRGKETAR
jgi:ketosteroid isomerase-like protein